MLEVLVKIPSNQSRKLKIERFYDGVDVPNFKRKKKPVRYTSYTHKFIIKDSPAFMGVKAGEMNMLQWVNVFITHKKLGGELNAMSEKWFGQALPALPVL